MAPEPVSQIDPDKDATVAAFEIGHAVVFEVSCNVVVALRKPFLIYRDEVIKEGFVFEDSCPHVLYQVGFPAERPRT